MVEKGYGSPTGSQKVVLGEIDTSSPFQSVKDAVTHFAEGAFLGGRSDIKKVKAHSEERVSTKETRLHLVRKELSKLKEQLENAEFTKAQALDELEKARRTVEDLNQRLKTVNELKDLATRETEVARNQAKEIEELNAGKLMGLDGSRKQDLCGLVERYASVITELDVEKKELAKIHQNCSASLEAKMAAFEQVTEAERSAQRNRGKVEELSSEISAMEESIEEVKLATLQAQQEQVKIFSEKDDERQSYRASLDESTKKLLVLRSQFDPELTKNLEALLAETVGEIGALQKEMESAKASDMESVKMVTSELDGAKEALLTAAEEESSLRRLVESLKTELENVKKENAEMKVKEAEMESIAGCLHEKLRRSKSELEALITEESKARGACEEMISTLQQLSVETENARREAEEKGKKADDLKKGAESSRSVLAEADQHLRATTEEAEEAKEAEKRVLVRIKALSERTNAARASTSEAGANIITISREEFESLSRKVEESDTLAGMKVAAALAQVEAVKASKHQAVKRLEASMKEITEMKAATEDALKRAEMAEAAKMAVEGELRKWRQQEQKKAAEAASRIFVEASPQHRLTQKPNSPEKISPVRKLEKKGSNLSKVLLPSISSIFRRKKNQIEGGSPSYLPGEKPL